MEETYREEDKWNGDVDGNDKVSSTETIGAPKTMNPLSALVSRNG
jgi:hypothetical protein